MPEKKRKWPGKKAGKRKQQSILAVIGGCLALILAVFGISYAGLYRYVHKVDDKIICDHIYIGVTDVSGMNEKQARAAVGKKLEEYGNLKLTLQVEEESIETTFAEAGLEMKDLDRMIKKAVSYGKKGSVWERYRLMRKLREEKLVIDDEFQLDEEKASQLIAEKASPLERRAVDAGISHTQDGFEITDETAGNKIDMEDSLKKITAYLNEKWEYRDTSLKLVLDTEYPRVTRADLETIQDELGSFSTDAGYGERVKNLKRAAELLNGRVIMPGEEFSVEQATVPYTEENGYVAGSAFENGEVVKSIGGGICQVSTTLYNAVLYAELEVTERSAHSMIVDYVEPSRDAAIAEGLKDFRFKNNYETPVMLEGYIDGNNQLQFHIYGKETRPESRSVGFESETLERTEYTTRYVEDSESGLGMMNREGSAFNGRIAQLWKVVYENGEEVSRDVINHSTYKASEIRIKVGTASKSAEASALVRNAIATQDQDQIREAIGQARALEANPPAEEQE